MVIRTAAILVTSQVLMALKPILLQRAQASGEMPLDPKLFLLFSELLKVVICTAALLCRRAFLGPDAARLWHGLRHTAQFLLPTGTFCLMHWLTIYTTSITRPASFQLLANMKIMTTAIAGWMVLSRHTKPSQWMAILLLMCSTMLGHLHEHPDANATFTEFLLVFLCVVLSALGSVFTERLLKAGSAANQSICAFNVHIAGHTLILNALTLVGAVVFSDHDLPSASHFNTWIGVALWNEAFSGIVLIRILQLTDSNIKNYLFSSSFFVTSRLAPSEISGQLPSWTFTACVLMVAVSFILYTLKPDTPFDLMLTRSSRIHSM
eukprot:gnl/TRDRNA2_/TRDRNA2_92890_c0_seq1.p1 gnl/TRDRNA2_/TRDRNA2_92890_c0~~gnl/TRDRNA2_/TRDRNA2_92890_c0_seq1.p1  ORF type:complete len:322 (-),score=19.65 gnl/TRDRNA2_/TRDRNA2_92890_c0_seq1:41-1006(-)